MNKHYLQSETNGRTSTIDAVHLGKKGKKNWPIVNFHLKVPYHLKYTSPMFSKLYRKEATLKLFPKAPFLKSAFRDVTEGTY